MIMKKKSILILVAVLATVSLASCGKKPNDDPKPGPGPDPGTEITSNNAAPTGFVDDGPMVWDE